MEYKIDSVTFGIMSDADVLDMSVCLVTGKKDLYDHRMGPLSTSNQCVTCSGTFITCPGHFGHIRLAKPIFHPLFIKKLLGQLKSTCYTFNGDSITTTKVCRACKTKQPVYKIVGHELLRAGTSVSPTEYPRFCMNYLPVLPHCARPKTFSGDDHLTLNYNEILKANRKKDVSIIFKRVLALMDNSKGSVRYSVGLIPKGIKERLNGKSGLVRQNIMGKRVNHAEAFCRT